MIAVLNLSLYECQKYIDPVKCYIPIFNRKTHMQSQPYSYIEYVPKRVEFDAGSKAR